MSGVETKEKGMNKRRDERENLKKKRGPQVVCTQRKKKGEGLLVCKSVSL